MTRLLQLPLLRSALIWALAGHWIANLLFDRDEYQGADEATLAHLFEPIIEQSVLIIALVLLITAARRFMQPAPHRRLAPAVLIAVYTGVQLAFFFAMETAERLEVASVAGATPEGGIFGEGFVPELLVAVVAACMLTVLALVTARAIAARRRHASQRIGDRTPTYRARLSHAPKPQPLIGAGSVRAPPLAART